MAAEQQGVIIVSGSWSLESFCGHRRIICSLWRGSCVWISWRGSHKTTWYPKHQRTAASYSLIQIFCLNSNGGVIMDHPWYRSLGLARDISDITLTKYWLWWIISLQVGFHRSEVKAMAAWRGGDQSENSWMIWKMISRNVKFTECVIKKLKHAQTCWLSSTSRFVCHLNYLQEQRPTKASNVMKSSFWWFFLLLQELQFWGIRTSIHEASCSVSDSSGWNQAVNLPTASSCCSLMRPPG